jgi:hypothetical protein
MRELPNNKPHPKISESIESTDVLGMLRFCLRCKTEKVQGAIFVPLGPTYWVDESGNFEPNNIPSGIIELLDIQKQLSVPDPALVKVSPIDRSGDSLSYNLSSGLSPEDISKRLGFKPNVKDDPSKVEYSWGFTVNGKRCGIWDYCGSRWSVYDPQRVLHLVFPEIQN